MTESRLIGNAIVTKRITIGASASQIPTTGNAKDDIKDMTIISVNPDVLSIAGFATDDFFAFSKSFGTERLDWHDGFLPFLKSSSGDQDVDIIYTINRRVT